jgi:hypothetical protein
LILSGIPWHRKTPFASVVRKCRNRGKNYPIKKIEKPAGVIPTTNRALNMIFRGISLVPIAASALNVTICPRPAVMSRTKKANSCSLIRLDHITKSISSEKEAAQALNKIA